MKFYKNNMQFEIKQVKELEEEPKKRILKKFFYFDFTIQEKEVLEKYVLISDGRLLEIFDTEKECVEHSALYELPSIPFQII